MGIPLRESEKSRPGSASRRSSQRQLVGHQSGPSSNAIEIFTTPSIIVDQNTIQGGPTMRQVPGQTSVQGRFNHGGVSFVFELESLPDPASPLLDVPRVGRRNRNRPVRGRSNTVPSDGSTESEELTPWRAPVADPTDRWEMQPRDVSEEQGRRERLQTIRRVIREHESLTRGGNVPRHDGLDEDFDQPMEEEPQSLSEDQLRACSNASNIVLSLISTLSERANSGMFGQEDLSRMVGYIRTILQLGPREAFGLDTLRQWNGNRERILSRLRRIHRNNPGWRSVNPDLLLHDIHEAIEQDDIQFLLEHVPRLSCEIYTFTDNDESALHVACTYGRSEIAQLLVDMGHPPVALCEVESTPLADAASGGFTDLVNYLSRIAPECITLSDVDGDTPLHNAARGNHAECCRILLWHGASSDAVNDMNEKPIQLCTPRSATYAVLNSRFAAMPRLDRLVLNFFQTFARLAEDQGLTAADIASLSGRIVSVSDVSDSIRRLVGLQVLDETSAQHYKVGPSLSALFEPATTP